MTLFFQTQIGTSEETLVIFMVELEVGRVSEVYGS